MVIPIVILVVVTVVVVSNPVVGVVAIRLCMKLAVPFVVVISTSVIVSAVTVAILLVLLVQTPSGMGGVFTSGVLPMWRIVSIAAVVAFLPLT